MYFVCVCISNNNICTVVVAVLLGAVAVLKDTTTCCRRCLCLCVFGKFFFCHSCYALAQQGVDDNTYAGRSSCDSSRYLGVERLQQKQAMVWFLQVAVVVQIMRRINSLSCRGDSADQIINNVLRHQIIALFILFNYISHNHRLSLHILFQAALRPTRLGNFVKL